MEERMPARIEIVDGKATVRGLAISVEEVLRLMAQRTTERQILAKCPALEAPDLAACVDYAENLAVSKRHIGVLDALASYYFVQDRNDESEHLFRRLIECDPENASLNAGLGAVLCELRQYERALAALDEALALDPNSAFAHEYRGWALYRLKRYEESIPCFERAIALGRDYGNLRMACGHARYALGDAAHKRHSEAAHATTPAGVCACVPLNAEAKAHFEAALKDLEAARDLKPERSMSHARIGDVYTYLQRNEEAIAAYRRAVELAPNDGDALFRLGWILFRGMKYQEAVEFLERSIAADPTRIVAYEHLGRAYRMLDRHKEARAAYEAALKVDPRHMAFHKGLFDALEHLGRWPEALEVGQQAIALDPNDFAPRVAYAGALEAVNRYPEALETLQEAIRIVPGNTQIHLAIARLYEAMHKRDEATAALREACHHVGEHVWNLISLSCECERFGLHDEAITLLSTLGRLSPQEGAESFDIARNQEALGQIEEARESYRRSVDFLRLLVHHAAEDASQDEHAEEGVRHHMEELCARSMLQLGTALVKVGEVDEAREVLARLHGLDEAKANALAKLLASHAG